MRTKPSLPGRKSVAASAPPASTVDAASEDGTPGDRFEDAQAILEHGFGRFDREALVERDAPYEDLPLPYRRDDSVELVATEDVFGPVDAASEERVDSATTIEPVIALKNRPGA